MNVKFHKNYDYTGTILKTVCLRCNFLKFDIHFLGLPREFVFCVTTDDLLHLQPLKNAICFKIFLVHDFCSLKIKITQCPRGFRLKQIFDEFWYIFEPWKVIHPIMSGLFSSFWRGLIIVQKDKSHACFGQDNCLYNNQQKLIALWWPSGQVRELN